MINITLESNLNLVTSWARMYLDVIFSERNILTTYQQFMYSFFFNFSLGIKYPK